MSLAERAAMDPRTGLEEYGGMLPLRRTALLATLVGCSAPDAAELPSSDLIGPAPPAALDCSLPYARFANAPFRWVDFDRGEQCTVFLEQDECVLGVFRDCTAGGQPREWQGSIDRDNVIRLTSFYPDPASSLPRRPLCCSGPLERPEDAPAWARLSCQINGCENPNDREHLGLYLEPESEPVPDGTVLSDSALVAPAAAAQRTFFVVAEQGPSSNGLWQLEGDTPRRVQAIEGARSLAVDASNRPWVAATDRLLGPGGLEWPLSGVPLALGLWSSGAVVALRDQLIWFDLNQRDPVRTRSVEASGVPKAIVTDPSDDTVYLLLGEPSEIIAYGPATEARRSLGEQSEGPPVEANWLDGNVVFVSRCHDAATVAHCLVFYDPATETADRIGLPTSHGLGRPQRGPGGRIWVPDRAGVVHVIEPAPRRPHLAATFALPSEVSFLTYNDVDRRWYAFGLTESRVWTVEQASGKD